MKKLLLLNLSVVIALLLSSIITTPSYAWTDTNKATAVVFLVTNKSFESSVDNISSNSAKLTGIGICWSCIWSTAKRMSASGIAGWIIKSYLKSKGFSCPSALPWFLCAKPVY